MALLVGLVVYTGAFIAEIVRAGIQSVPRGQVEAAKALGMGEMETIKLVVFPQALPVIIPPLISQYLNITKNSSLAIAIGYPDLFSVGRIMINQAGRAVPILSEFIHRPTDHWSPRFTTPDLGSLLSHAPSR